MSWNEPGKGSDPWGGGGKHQGPPDLDEIVRNMQRKLGALFGGGGGRRGGGNSGLAWLIPGVVLAFWLLSGVYSVDSAERGVVLRFGKFETTTMPGLHWHLPWPIESRELVNVSQIQPFSYKTHMLTKDQNIVQVDMVVQYRVKDPYKYLFNVRDADLTLNEVAESSIREVVGKHDTDFIIGKGREQIAKETADLIQATLGGYDAGLEVLSVNLQKSQLPDEVQAAVEDATRAGEDKDRIIHEAETYENSVVPEARGNAARIVQEAEAYKQQVVADATGESQRFTELLKAYRKSPNVTRRRLYLQTMEEVLGNTATVVVDSKQGGNMFYLPLDKLLEKQKPAASNSHNPSGKSGSKQGGGK
ncbi:MAG: FtsH protease activity modulator HflK [Gammaproteobacteria bacterium]|jgi:membrane protease subunit HflK